jgi:transposase
MVFIKKIKKKNGTYLAEVEGKWINGKSVHKHIRYIGAMPKKHDNLSKSDQKIIRNLEIIQKLFDGKNKEDLSILYEVDVKTINNIKSRFDEKGFKGLIHTRKSKFETIKVSNSDQINTIYNTIKNPEKSFKELIGSENSNLPLKEMKKIFKKVQESLKLKKKIFLEIQ